MDNGCLYFEKNMNMLFLTSKSPFKRRPNVTQPVLPTAHTTSDKTVITLYSDVISTKSLSNLDSKILI